MKIAAIEVFQVDLPYSGGTYRLSGGRDFTSFDATFVRIETACGLVGWGESTPFGATYIAAHALGTRAGIAELAPRLLGCDPRQTDRVYDLMDQTLVGHRHAKTAIDLACWDIFGQAVGLPVHMLLGGSTGQPLALISSIHAGPPDDMRQRVAEHREAGYRGHSVKIGATEAEGGPSLDVERISASLADREPGEYFIVDANGGLTVEAALRILSLLPDGLDFCLEAPCATWRETLSLRQRCRLPIILDELMQDDSDLAQIIALDAADGIGLKVSKAGGLTPARRQRDMARAAGLTMSVQDTVGSEISFAGILHLGQTVPSHLLSCVLDVRGMVTQKTAELDVRKTPQGVMLGDAPGLGLSVDQSVMGEPVARDVL
ncbi:MAG: mandelate racemase/muconate lactonizing enzyme family protein [Alphaproteobacteria bacterium]